MEYRRPVDVMGMRCWKPGCSTPAAWEFYTGPGYEDVNATCGAHISDLAEGATVEHIVPLYPQGKSFIDFLFDGPPGPVNPGFIDAVAFHDNGVGHQGPHSARPVRAGEWVQADDGWRLRIPVPGGWLVG